MTVAYGALSQATVLDSNVKDNERPVNESDVLGSVRDAEFTKARRLRGTKGLGSAARKK